MATGSFSQVKCAIDLFVKEETFELLIGERVALRGVDDRLRSDPAVPGVFLSATLERSAARARLSLGEVPGLSRFASCFRFEPFWMKPRLGGRLSEVPVDTQWLLCELDSSEYLVVVPLVSGSFRCSLEGREGELWAVAETGDPRTVGSDVLVAYIGIAADPYPLMRDAARAIAERLETVRLRSDKPLPDFVDDFGWCTWDAFYRDVSHDNVRLGLESFRRGGVEPRFLILDDGWQSVRPDDNQGRLYSFDANHKFSGALRHTVKLAKEQYRVKTFMVWHAVYGYWCGIDEALRRYGAKNQLRWYSPEVLSHTPHFNWEYWGPYAGIVSPEFAQKFYDEYHEALVRQGVDGVKVDNQASIEGLCHAVGSRSVVMRRTREALEQSVEQHFAGRLINCMSCSNDMLLSAKSSTLTRTSTDFWPSVRSSHGLHVYTNAMVGLFFGEFVHPDWDMFQSGHEAGSFHAAARAVSGAPVYVSDKPGEHDFDLLRRLVLKDGRVLRADHIGRPTRDSLFVDPTEQPVLFKVFNFNLDAAVVGLFNAHSREQDRPISGTLSPSDVPGLAGDEFAVYCDRARNLSCVFADAKIDFELSLLESDVATLVPLDRGVAPIGLVNLLNPAGAIAKKGWASDCYRISLKAGGDFVAFSRDQPSEVRADEKPTEFSYGAGRLALTLPAGAHELELSFDK